MATFCTVCGAKIEEGSGFCTQCGAKVEAARESFTAQPVVQTTVAQGPNGAANTAAAPNPQPAFAQNNINQVPMPGSAYEPVSTGAFLGTLILLGIPLVGFIYSIVCAFGGCRKINMRNFCRGYLILQIIGVVLGVVICVLMYVLAMSGSGVDFKSFFEGIMS